VKHEVILHMLHWYISASAFVLAWQAGCIQILESHGKSTKWLSRFWLIYTKTQLGELKHFPRPSSGT